MEREIAIMTELADGWVGVEPISTTVKKVVFFIYSRSTRLIVPLN
jgi:hypothetical protein